jgi:hypothetical protein
VLWRALVLMRSLRAVLQQHPTSTRALSRPPPSPPHPCAAKQQRLSRSIDQSSIYSDGLAAAAADGAGAGEAAAGATTAAGRSQADLVRRASKALLRQVEETRRKYALEVEGLKAEVGLLQRERARHEREVQLAAAAASAATRAAAAATDELERVNGRLKEARRALDGADRCGAVPAGWRCWAV